jgi:hypothetical protein
MDYLSMEENVCPVCGKMFNTAIGREWGWSYKGSRYCSYHCMRHIEIRHRIEMGWQNTPYRLSVAALDGEQMKVAEGLIRLRHLRKAYDEMSQVQEGDQGALSAVTNRIGQQYASAVEHWRDAINRLDDKKRRLAEVVFVEAVPLEKVARDMDIDTDLLQTKLHLLYVTLAKVCV